MAKARFKAELVEGHKGVTVVIVPFEPEAVWRQKPVRLAGRRHGWLVKGAVNQVKFSSYIGERWGRFFIALEAGLRKAAGLAVGEQVSVVVEPTSTRGAYLLAVSQSKRTTQPTKARADAVTFGATKPSVRKQSRR